MPVGVQGTISSSDGFGKMLSRMLKSIKEEEEVLKKQKENKKGHGRLRHEDYLGATVISQEHEFLKPGDLILQQKIRYTEPR